MLEKQLKMFNTDTLNLHELDKKSIPVQYVQLDETVKLTIK